MKAIQTKYLPATNTRGNRIKAYAEGVKPLTIPYPHELSGSAVHAAAAVALCRRMGWAGTLVSGGMPDQSGEVFCFMDSEKYEVAA